MGCENNVSLKSSKFGLIFQNFLKKDFFYLRPNHER